MSPEVLLNEGQTLGVDWWALGILVYEMLIGKTPFHDDDPAIVPNPLSKYEKIIQAQVKWPTEIEQRAKDLVNRLLVADATRRIGNLNVSESDVYSEFINSNLF